MSMFGESGASVRAASALGSRLSGPSSEGASPVPWPTAFQCLTSDPSTGVCVVSTDLRIGYMNDQAAEMFHGMPLKGAAMVGSHWGDFMPAAWVQERVQIQQAMLVHARPVLVRSIWRDCQHFTWINHIEPEGAGVETKADAFLWVTRRSAGDDLRQALAGEGFERVDSKLVRLERLRALTSRELEVMALLGQGLSVREAAKVLFRSEKTVERHRDAIHAKLRVSDRAELVRIALRAGLGQADVAKTRV
jgi:DNA-binding CsgD family transcriptional regulator